ncbi:hypothetical protein MPSEU_000383400 [Mayamaea pseudoterrestris]|nr:hypothetical protein MPSEU_000383400 [Mayamaea pseudoterrestris]
MSTRVSNKNNNRFKRQREEAKNLPAFWDASSTVSAGTFAARRLPEVKSLYRHAVEKDDNSNANTSNKCTMAHLIETNTASGGRKTSSRHLRRRATSHAGRKRHRYPKGNGSNQQQQVNDNDPEKEIQVDEKQPCRRKRRKPAQMRNEHMHWMQPNVDNDASFAAHTSNSSALSTSTVSNSPVRWIPTHVWHAERFRMQTLWNWKVPVMHSQRGAGAAIRLLVEKSKTLLQDVTWTSQAVCLRVKAEEVDAFKTLLQRIMPDFIQRCGMTEQGRAVETAEHTARSECTLYDGMLHEPDQFPRGAIGPVRCVTSRKQPLLRFEPSGAAHGDADHDGVSNDYFCYIRTHPSIQLKLYKLLSLLVEGLPRDSYKGPYQSSSCLDGCGMACLRLRGRFLADCIKLALEALMKDMDAYDTVIDTAIARVVGGEVIKLPIRPHSEFTSTCLVLLPCATSLTTPTAENIDSIDLLCDALLAKQLFLALVMHGGACPIGMVEEASLLLEVPSPPIPVFPRDYLDTLEGETYWKGLADDWGYVRRHLEGGTGRIRASGGPQSKERNWTDIVDDKDQRVVAIRGTFGNVLWNALQSAGNIPASVSSETKLCRIRRPTRQPWELGQAPLLSMEAAKAHTQLCANLIQSLTLPAIIICHLTILGKGTIVPGTKVRSVDKREDKLLLGFVTACSFSPSRGATHGLVICGAARWLEAVSLAREDNALLLGNSTTGQKLLCLGVAAGGCSKIEPAFGSLSLFL